MAGVLGATLCLLVYAVRSDTQHTNATTTGPSASGPTEASTPDNLTDLERSMKETDSILRELEKTIEEAKALMKERNITLDIRDIDYKGDYRPFLASLLDGRGNRSAPSEYAAPGAGEGAGRNLTAARRHKELKLKLFDFVSVTGKKKKHKELEREKNRIVMQGKIDEWLLNRELEKKKIKNYIDRVKVAKQEKCPRTGMSRKRKKKKTRRRDDGTDGGGDGVTEEPSKKKKKKKHSKFLGGKKYPCCRKCCKRSYMGCL